MNLTAHFTLDELTVSQEAVRAGIDNTPPADVIDALRLTAATLENVRLLLGVPIIITSGYRSPPLNRRVGGSANSAHCDGLAADFIAPRYGNPAAIARAIDANAIAFDQLILEFGRWVHLGVHPVHPRRQALTAVRRPEGGTEYLLGIKP